MDDFSIKNRLYMYHFLEQGDVFQTFFSKYKGISDTRPVVERGAVMLSEVGKTAILIDVEQVQDFRLKERGLIREHLKKGNYKNPISGLTADIGFCL